MPDQLKSGIENLSGYSMDDVKVHYNSSKPAQLNAHAYAQGTNIHVAPNQEKHVPHEAWHVVQQKQGRVKPTTQLKQNVAINDDPKLENEADKMGTKALQHASKEGETKNSIQAKATGETIQQVLIDRVRGEHNHTYNNVNTLAGLNLVLHAHNMAPITTAEIFRRLRPNGRKASGPEMFTRNDGITLDEYVQLRVGNLADGALTPIANLAVGNMGQTYYDNRTNTAYQNGDIAANTLSIESSGGKYYAVPRQQILGHIRAEVNTYIAGRQPQTVVVPGGNNYRITGIAAQNFITNEDATLTAMVRALGQQAVAHNGAWNVVRIVRGNNNYDAELKLGGIPGRRIFARTGSVTLSVIGDSLH